jgi:EAL and modified HD-GYP domain-containing signal transduction protein
VVEAQTTAETFTAGLPDGLLIARRPILDRERQVFAYQLLLHALPPAALARPGKGGATSVSTALDRCGLEALTLGGRAFMRMSSAQLHPTVMAVFPPERVVAEVSADDEGAGEECKALRSAGYSIALDDFTLDSRTAGLIPLAGYLKVDFLPSSSDHACACVEAGTRVNAALVAKSVDAPEVFAEAVREGFTYFQGHLIEQRRAGRGQRLAPNALASLQILHALADPNLSLGRVEELVKRDAGVSYRVLRLANSAGAAQTREVTSMQHALLLVGRDVVRRWASIAIMAGLGTASPDELLVMATVRARFAEILGELVGGDEGAGTGFLLGLCSLLDVVLGQSMADVLDDLPLPDDVRHALLGRDNHLRRLLDSIVAYERGEWTSCVTLANLAGLDPRALAPAYLEALRFAYEIKKA